MKMTKLFAGVAATALLAGASHAQISSGDQDANATNDLGASLVFASEFDIAGTGNTQSGHVELGFGASEDAALAALAATDSVTIQFNVSGGLSWDGNLSDANHIGADTNCEFNISAAGGTGTQTVSYALDGASEDATACAGNDLDFRFPIDIVGAGNISYSMSLTATGTVLASGTLDVDGGTAGTQGYVRQAQAYTFTFADNATSEQITLASDYESFGASAGLIGTISGATTAGTIVAAANAGNTAAAISTAAQITGGSLVLTLPNATGIASATLALPVAADQTVAVVGNTVTFPLAQTDIDDLDGAAASITLNEATGADAAAIANQQPTAELTVTSATTLTVAGASATNATHLDELVREGSNSTTFEWVGDSNASTGNVFRFVGFGATLPVIRVTLTNSNTTGANGEYVVTPSNALNNGELIVTAADIETAVGSAFGRADIAFSVEAGGVTVRRFMVTNGVIGDMGDDNG